MGTAAALALEALPIASASATSANEIGLNIDVARRYWTPESLARMIDLHASFGGTYVHLHATDDARYGIESTLLGQRAQDAIVKGSVYTNPKTGNEFLTFAQLRALRARARTRGVDLFIEVNTPGHASGIRELLEIAPRAEYPVDDVFSSWNPNEIDVHSETALKFAKALYRETAGILPGARVHIGGDEFSGGTAGRIAWARYANAITATLRQYGAKSVLAWNDGFTFATRHLLRKDIVATYWDYTTWRPPGGRLSLSGLLSGGFRALNYCGYYTYWVPTVNEPQSDRDFAAWDLRERWNLGVYAEHSWARASPTHPGLLGGAMSIWGENSGGMSDVQLWARSRPLLQALTAKLR